MDESDFLEHVCRNPNNRVLFERLPGLGVPDLWLVSGALFQTAWNTLTGRDPAHGIKDYDVFYFDPLDLSWEAEDKVIKRAVSLFEDAGIEVEIRNQARAHLWYGQRFGMPYPALGSSCEGIDRFLIRASMVGAQSTPDGGLHLYAPAGLDDIAALRVRPNLTRNFNANHYREKAERWKTCWPELTIESPD